MESKQKTPKSSTKFERHVREIFAGTNGMPALARGLDYVLRKYVKNTDVAGGPKEVETVRAGCVVAENVLRLVALEGSGNVLHES